MSEIIGVIGGAGVAATNKLLELIEIKVTKGGAFRDCHHPEMIIYQATQVPSRSMFLEGRGESFVSGYVDVAKKLKNAGATKCCMCCNTAHYLIDEIQEKSNIEFINLIKEVVLRAKSSGKTKFAIVASQGAINGKVYEKYFSEYFPQAELIYPDESLQKLVTKGICNVKNTSRFLDKNHQDNPNFIFETVKNKLIVQGAQCVIMGCTDIRVAYSNDDVIDSLEVLADSILKII